MWEEGSTLGLRKKEELHRSCTACSVILLYDRVGACIGRRKRLGFARGGHQRALVASGRHLGRLGIHRVCVRVQADDGHRDLEARIALLFSRSSDMSAKSRSAGDSAAVHHHRSSASLTQHQQQSSSTSSASTSRRHHRRSHVRTQPYNDTDEQVMDDEELHSLLGV